jgi:predicted  nucleic acid-binding Zn-ribbon protein
LSSLLPVVHPHVKKLLELQKVDQEIASLRKDLDSLPAEEAKRKKKLDELERVAAERKERANKTELDARALEKAIKGSDEEIRRLNERSNLVRNNAEYQAILFQIESVKKDRDQTQEECLRILDSQEALKQQHDAASAALAAERTVFEQFVAEAQRLRANCDRQLQQVQQRRSAAAGGIPAELLGEYDNLFRTRDRLAVCAVEGGFCQGCYNKITANDIARLTGRSVVVQCGSCQRILYLNR